jgi:hypothetical protein
MHRRAYAVSDAEPAMSANRRQRFATGAPSMEPPRRVSLERANGRPLGVTVAARMRAALGHDFSSVRVHTDAAAAATAGSLGARAFTVGNDIGFAQGKYAPHTAGGAQLLAHELVHTVQQRNGQRTAAPSGIREVAAAEAEAEGLAAAVARGGGGDRAIRNASAAGPQFDLESPGRLAEVHERLFVSAPGGGARRPWRDPSGADEGTAGELFAAFRRHIDAMRRRHRLDETYIPERTTEAQADADALAVDRRIRARFPFITRVIDPAEITRRVQRFGESRARDVGFVRQWVENRLATVTDLPQYALPQGDARVTRLIDSILADRVMGRYVPMLAVRVAAFHEESSGERNVFLNVGINAAQRVLTLIHELTHFYVHPTFNAWLAATGNEDFYGEGFTEYLARLVMTDDERGGARSSYQERWEAVRDEVAANVPDDDIARAYFLGEVWRLETRSAVARREFGAAGGIRAGATAREEAAQSRAGPGINQEVVPDAHYRFLNLGHDRAEPKREHVDYFQRLKSRLLDPQPAVEVKFVGHASSPGSRAHNDRLSLARAQAFYRMARDQGIPNARLRDASPPEHHGEHVPTLTEEDPQTRAFNRRVEMFLSGVARTPGTSTGTTSAPAAEREEER